jgi:hypothetical protein
VPAVVVLACHVPADLVALGLFTLCGQSLRRVPPPALAGDGSTVVLCHPLCAALSSILSSRASLHFASAPLAYLCVAPPGQASPAYTNLKQPWQPLQVFALSQSLLCLLLQPALGYTQLKQHLQPLQIFNQKIWPCKKPFLAGKTFPSPKLKPPTLQRTLCHRILIG